MPRYMDYRIGGRWGERDETPDDLAKNLGALLGRLREIEPRLLSTWFQRWEDRATERVDLSDLPRVVTEGLSRDEYSDEPEPDFGYHVDLSSAEREIVTGDILDLGMTGASLALNKIDLSTPYDLQAAPALISHINQRQMALAIADTFNPFYTVVTQSNLSVMKDYKAERDYVFPVIPLCYMVDLSPALARVAVPRSGLIVEHRPNGHLFLSAVEEDFDVENPAHVAAAWNLFAVIHPLNKLPSLS